MTVVSVIHRSGSGQYKRIAHWLIAAIVLFLFFSFIPATMAYAQLLSPGKLSRAHHNLEGLTHCTDCHILGKRGISDQLCLNCHTAIKKRIDEHIGYHSSIDVMGKNCATCHNEHIGVNFKLIQWDTTKFDHRKTGYALIGRHMKVACRSCHKPAFITASDIRKGLSSHKISRTTYLGLSTACNNCHLSDNVHGKQFSGMDCRSCHTPYGWKDSLRFDHAKTGFPLLGKHMSVSCSSCHKKVAGPGHKLMVKYTGLAYQSCTDCHRDVHHGTMGTTCSNCHTVDGWHIFKKTFTSSNFNHSKTGFPLIGKHAKISCSSCHNPSRLPRGIVIHFEPSTIKSAFPLTKVKDCQSCHVDYHRGTFRHIAGGTNCENCHTQSSWSPSTFDLIRHNKTAFKLTGAHAAVPCYSCHRSAGNPAGTLKFHMPYARCESCHSADNPHGLIVVGTQNLTCSDCHTTMNWNKTKKSFSHALTGFALTGRHAIISCTDCHKPVGAGTHKKIVFTGLVKTCRSCHAGDSPHQNQFKTSVIGDACNNCHDTKSFHLTSFDHSRTRFPLTGAHANLACESCHKTEIASNGIHFIRYYPLSTKCESCHASQ